MVKGIVSNENKLKLKKTSFNRQINEIVKKIAIRIAIQK